MFEALPVCLPARFSYLLPPIPLPANMEPPKPANVESTEKPTKSNDLYKNIKKMKTVCRYWLLQNFHL
ncbi:predicted protein [Histoplasma mississippiense (nom. inval.)]|uniref:predicted protein n=1 Tax=Ajellomyces capsulatus (strain NAm1 / WU24) TaxID=2059318 RepID=UPI000157D480|nr:predicted protein [Histoplasma mississippiense (nom. inval.)]EDN08362.1 predicted protein [Histoplasma mississippiense (nom. inval.)]